MRLVICDLCLLSTFEGFRGCCVRLLKVADIGLPLIAKLAGPTNRVLFRDVLTHNPAPPLCQVPAADHAGGRVRRVGAAHLDRAP